MDREMLRLFMVFLKIGVFTFGGGYAMLPILQREVVEKHGWVSENDLAEYYAIGQTTPGIIAINTATFVGYRKFGVVGAVVATLGLALPGIVIIAVIANLITGFSDWKEVRHAMEGIKVAVTVLIFDAMLKLRKNSLIDSRTTGIFLFVLAIAVFFPRISPVVLVIAAGGLGLWFSYYDKGEKK